MITSFATITDTELLEAAVVGLQQSIYDVNSRITAVKDRLRGEEHGTLASTFVWRTAPRTRLKHAGEERKKRKPLSKEAIERIRAAQIKRWAKIRRAAKAKK